jgi:hypothetical protein
MRRRWSFASLVLVAGLFAGSATFAPASYAQSAADKAAARALADDADAALAAKNYGTAAEKYQKALGLVPTALTLRLGLARAQAGIGKYLEATESYNNIIRTPLDATAPAPFRVAQQEAEREIAETSTRVGAVVITLVVPGGRPGPATPWLQIDDEKIPAALIGERRPANPGRHTIRFRADGFEPAEARVEVKAGATTPVSITLVAAAAPPATTALPPASGDPSAPPPLPPPTTVTADKPDRTAAYVALGLGGAGVVVGSIAGVLAISKHSSLKSDCQDGCPSGAQHDIDSYRTTGAISTIGFVVGGVGLTAGSVLYLLAKPTPSSAAVRANPTAVARGFSWRPLLGPFGVGAAGSF